MLSLASVLLLIVNGMFLFYPHDLVLSKNSCVFLYYTAVNLTISARVRLLAVSEHSMFIDTKENK